jgi:UDP-3-O-[3-hydroxymyristoyl] N-acetylglucosamine deacetylase
VYEQFEQLRAAGLIKGGSLDNALVCSVTKGWLNPPLRFPAEPCRHKLLDLIGDLALAGAKGFAGLPTAHVVAYKASHALHVAFAKAFLRACMSQLVEVSSRTSR